MGGTLESVGLRLRRPEEAALFASWEAAERPYPWSASGFPADTIVFENAGRIDGYAVVKIAGGEAYLSNLMVASTLRRKGTGAKMLQKVMMWAAAEGADQMLLDVDVANLPAIGLYQKLGFELVERRAKSYPRGEDAFIMRKKL